MDMMTFFQTVIPSDGFKFLIEVTDKGKMHHYPFVGFDDMVERAEMLIAAGKPFYHACASYKEIRFNGLGYPVGRTQDNVKFAKAIWQDFDVGKIDKTTGKLKVDCYATRKDAAEAIASAMKATGLPRPLLISSGNGFHAYWPFTEAVTPEQWHALAVLVRTAFRFLNIKFDATRDMDIASILRPVGSFNKGTEVTVVREQTPRSYEFYFNLFSAYIMANSRIPAATKATKAILTNEFNARPEFPPSSLARVAARCEQVRLFRDTGGVAEPVWRLSLGVAKYCTDGEVLGHEWSEQYPGYTQEETQGKLDRWMTPPTTCAAFEKANPAGCKDCPFAGKVTTPVQLGYEVETTPPVIEEQTQARPRFWPDGFSVTPSGTLQMIIKDKDDVPQPIKVASPVFYIKERIRTDDGTYAYTVSMNVRNTTWRDFPLPAKCMADIRSLKQVLASYEVMVHNDKLVEMYAKSYAIDARLHMDEINTFRQFGWTEDREGFLIGDTLITREGRKKVRTSEVYIRAESLLKAAEVKGNKEEYAAGVDKLYNRPGGEPWQYAICTQFGAPLMALLDFKEWNGIPLALTSGDSGYGKTTVIKIGQNALFNSDCTTLGDMTPKGILGRASIMNNVPMLIDEVTRSLPDPDDLNWIIYSLSDGHPRGGMQSDGKERAPLPSYKQGASITGNKNLFAQLSRAKLNPEATQMRLFEIPMENYTRMDTLKKDSPLHAEHHELALHMVNNVYGVFLDDYFEFVFANMEEIKNRLYATAMAVIKSMGGEAAKERFYAYHMTCALVGGWLGRRIKALKFDMNNMKRWSYRHVLFMRSMAAQYSESVEDKFSHMLSSLHGSILVTKHFDLLDSRAGQTEMPMLQIKNDIAARLVLGSDKERGKLYVAVSAIDEWCSKHDASPVQFKRDMAQANMLRFGNESGRGYDKKVSISRGVPSHPMGRCRCLEFDFSAAQGYVEEFVKMDNVTPLIAPVPPAPTVPPASLGQQGP